MPDVPKDRSKIDVTQPAEVLHWCGKLGCSETQLRTAVRVVGVAVNKVRAHLLQRK